MENSIIECHICGELNNSELTKCSKCETPLEFDSSNNINDEDACLNCSYFRPSEDIECPVLAKKWDRDRIEIDCPDSMHCESHRRI